MTSAKNAFSLDRKLQTDQPTPLARFAIDEETARVLMREVRFCDCVKYTDGTVSDQTWVTV